MPSCSLPDFLTLLLSLLAFHRVGTLVFRRQLCRSHYSRHRGVQELFATTLALCLLLFELFVLEVLHWMDEAVRLLVWTVALYTVVAQLTLSLPLALAYYSLRDRRCRPLTCLLGSALAEMAFLVLLRLGAYTTLRLSRQVHTSVAEEAFAPTRMLHGVRDALDAGRRAVYALPHLPQWLPSVGQTLRSTEWSALALQWFTVHFQSVATLGTVLIAAMSGVGSASWVVDWLSDWMCESPTLRELDALEQRLMQCLQQVRAEKEAQCLTAAPPRNVAHSERQLERTFLVYSRLVTRLEQERASTATITGRLWTLASRLFAAFCVYRIVASVVHLLLPAAPGTDAVSAALSFAVERLGLHIDVETWSRYLVFLVSAALIGSATKWILTEMDGAYDRFTRRNVSLSTSVPVLLAELTGFYVVSFLVLLRGNLPSTYRYRALHWFEQQRTMQVFQELFTETFLYCAVLALAVFAKRARDAQRARHHALHG
ncbi:hypothetical protein CDCA_CDCA14G3745 [Cyanidium caldarium]|uniref:Abscisic acid G-protein coupled receptor-like domain-containing protein n=1 Tax=Cyanidium caldarium TaxID=2771 RepID=A0AAV9J073_CYACA|nr:hypothetical protein CDCA_CDCA14G3745 [Cyanidium caldarium]